MKKIYIIPETIVVRLMPSTIIAESAPVGDEPVNPGEVLTKENTSSEGGKNIWDEEW